MEAYSLLFILIAMIAIWIWGWAPWADRQKSQDDDNSGPGLG